MATKKSAKKTVRENVPAAAPGALENGSQSRAADREDWKVRIRMYRKWLGDCFLLTFRDGDQASHIMIDCGALSGTPEGKQKITEAVEDIFRETGGNLAALVVTHEHWDHVSGFLDAIDSFKKFSIGEVWAAWTEDPNQPIAKEKKKRNQLLFDSVQSALRSWGASGSDADQERGSAVAAIMRFMPPGGLAAFSTKSDAAMTNALSLGKQRLLSPGDTVEPGEVPGLRVYVLGPPGDIGELHTMTGEVGKDMYGFALGSSQIACTEAFFSAAAGEDGSRDPDRFVPFEPYLHWEEAAWLKQEKWSDLARSYNAEPERKIDRDWLNTAAELALQLDSYTNNTSLVLAFELTDSKEVLLFVGDAQVGNWRSWVGMKFSEPNVSAADLLSRTIFYKVGHHGSHNATLEQGGLEAMTSPKLVAAIPVDEEFAHRPKGGCPKGWDMPAGPLLAALMEKTAGRVLRGDSDFPKGSANPGKLSNGDWNEFKQNTNVEEHFIEYFVR
ncbi:MAG: MBL fold metallo-hydrolase [Syntrophobacteraceae bacterium]